MEKRETQVPRSYYDQEEPEWPEETKNYRLGTAIIYKQGARKKKPKGYGYKFVETQSKK